MRKEWETRDTLVSLFLLMPKQKKPRSKRILKFLIISLSVLVFFAILLTLSLFVYAATVVHPEEDTYLFESAKGGNTTFIYYNGGKDAHIDTANDECECIGIVGYTPIEWEKERLTGGEICLWTPFAEMPDTLKKAIVAIEDHRFYEHKGVDFLRTAKAMVNYVFRFDGSFGGSSITQQLIKNISGDREKSVGRKVREIARALSLEKSYGKDEILELYLNIIPLSDGCIGVGAAAEHYFSKKPSELSLVEAASLVAITNSPTAYNPRKHPENHRRRRDLVLSKMYEHGMISEAEYKEAQASPVSLSVSEEDTEKVSSWYTETVIEDVITDLINEKNMTRESASRAIYGGGLKIYTCMDKEIQDIVEGYFSNASFDKDYAYAMTVTDSDSGDLLAVVGREGKKTNNRVLNYATTLRAPGSAIKPLTVYAPALEEGLITFGSVFDDVPVLFRDKGTYYRPWPYNADYIYSGLTTVSEAVSESKNTVAVRILNMLGYEKAYHYLTEGFSVSGAVRSGKNQAGETVSDLASAPLALGQMTYGVTLRNLTTAYGAFSNGGVTHKSRSYLLVLDKNGSPLLTNTPESHRVVSEENAAIMTKLLEGVVEDGTAKSITLSEITAVAGKTGTTTKGENRLFVGYTPELCAGVFAGYVGDGTPSMKFKGHLSVWDEVMKRIVKLRDGRRTEKNAFSVPDGVIMKEFCTESGKCLCDACRLDPRGECRRIGYFKKGTEPMTECDRHITVLYDTRHGGVASDACIKNGNPEYLTPVSLVWVTDRDFPTEVVVSDAQYVYRDMIIPPSENDATKPFFCETLPEGRYVGVSVGVGKPQYNTFCCFHFEGNSDAYEDDGEAEREERNEENDLPPPFPPKVEIPPPEKRKNRGNRFFPFQNAG